MSKIQLIATAAFGLEAVVARELKNLGYTDQMVENSRVTFSGDELAVCRSNLWLRSADRVLVKMGEFTARTFEELFQQTKALPWPDWLPADAEFPVNGKSINSQLSSVPACQAIVKKAIVEKMKLKYGSKFFPENGPKYVIEVALLKDVVTLTIDTSGSGLHKRGYRKLTAEAPLKETLAAAMIQLSYWRTERTLVDPCCGSGTIPIEAAMIGLNMAPGLKRNFAAESWSIIPKKYWSQAREEANDAIKRDVELNILGSDINPEVLSLARYHCQQAGVDEHVSIQKLPLESFRSRKKYGCIITNPPYGMRLGEEEEAADLYRQMKETFKPLDTWSIYVITSHPGFERLFGRKADRKRKLYNGRIQCNYYQFYGPRPPKKEQLSEISDTES